MSQKIENILSNFSDLELAFFSKYRLNSYSSTSQKVIKSWILRSGLKQEKIDKLVKLNEFNKSTNPIKPNCPRCSSNKLFSVDEEIFNGSSVNLFDGETFRQDIEKIELRICFVCGFNLAKDKKPSIFSRFFKLK
jgi:hypothetical protein